MESAFSHKVTLLGREFNLRSQISSEKVSDIEQFVNERLSHVSSSVVNVDGQSIATLALLNLAGEFLEMRSGNSQLGDDSSERISSLIRRLDSEL